ncbi:MAG: hypothetical protein PVF70_02060 [Anaerolineales bacterium]|jgi:hypothetical protein
MTSLREAIRRLILGKRRSSTAPAEISILADWTSRARGWDAKRRREVRAAIMRKIKQPDFVDEAFERRFHVPELDASAHSGASLLALLKVLDALDADSPGNGGPDDTRD